MRKFRWVVAGLVLFCSTLISCSVVHVTTPFFSTISDPVLPTPLDETFLTNLAEMGKDVKAKDWSLTAEIDRVRRGMQEAKEDRYWAAQELMKHEELYEIVPAALIKTDEEFDNPYTSAKVCGECHPKHFDEWSVSSHAYAQMSPVFNAMHGTIVKLTNGTFGDFCIRCHTPVGMNLNEPQFMANELRNVTSREGITCVVCHRVAHDYGKISGRMSLVTGNIFTEVYGPSDATILNEEKKAKRLQDSPDATPGQRVHGTVKTLPTISESGFCGQCHDVTLKNGFRLEEAFSEYKASPAAGDGVSCQDCHMGKTPGKPDGGYDMGPAAIIGGKPTKSRKLTNHMMAGPDYSVIHPGLFPHLSEAYGNPNAQDVKPFFAELTPGRYKKVAGRFVPIPLWLDFDWRGGWGKPDWEKGIEDIVLRVEEIVDSLPYEEDEDEADADDEDGDEDEADADDEDEDEDEADADDEDEDEDEADEDEDEDDEDEDDEDEDEEELSPEQVAKLKAELAELLAKIPDFKSWGGKPDLEDITPWYDQGKALRVKARNILEERQFRLLAEYRRQQHEVLRAGYQIDRIEVHEGGSSGIDFTVVVKNGTDGHNVPTGFIAERSVFLQVNVMDAEGNTVFASGDLDPNGDVRDLHSTFVHDGEKGSKDPLWEFPEGPVELSDEPVVLDPFLFTLQSKFIARNFRGSQREQIIAANYSFDPLPFLRPPTFSAVLSGEPRGARTHRTGIRPGETRSPRYTVSASDLTGPGPYKAEIRLVTGMVPVNLVNIIAGVGLDYGLSPRELAREIVNGSQAKVPQPTAIGHKGLVDIDESVEPVEQKINGRQVLWEYEIVFDGNNEVVQLVPNPESK